MGLRHRDRAIAPGDLEDGCELGDAPVDARRRRQFGELDDRVREPVYALGEDGDEQLVDGRVLVPQLLERVPAQRHRLDDGERLDRRRSAVTGVEQPLFPEHLALAHDRQHHRLAE